MLDLALPSYRLQCLHQQPTVTHVTNLSQSSALAL
jgi:hypothetical protein